MKKNIGNVLALYPTPAVVVDNYETETFDNFICKITNTYVEEYCLNEKGKPDYDKLNPVLFEMPNYTYLRIGKTIGKCTSFGKVCRKEAQ